MSNTLAGLEIERRITVRGWKVEGGERREFAETHFFYSNDVEYYEKRMREVGLKDWQPHITGFVIEERVVSPWRGIV